MILNEDFFNDIEIKDEDLTVEQSKTPRELLEHKMSESEMVLMINIFKIREGFDIWYRIKRMMKILKYMFNIYNINISEPFLTYTEDVFDILRYKKFPDDYTIIQHKGCNLYFEESALRKYGPDKVIMKDVPYLFVFLDKKIPVFTTARSAYNFVNNLNKCIWRDPNYDDGCFSWYGLYNINDVYFEHWLINGYSFSFSYINNDGTWIYNSVLNIVPKELAEQLRNIEHSRFINKILTKDDVKEIIKLVDQHKNILNYTYDIK